MKAKPIVTTKKPKVPIKTIDEELADCRKAFRKYKRAKYCWCCHHETLCEALDENGPEQRIRFIVEKKDLCEVAVRLRNFRPIICKEWDVDSQWDYYVECKYNPSRFNKQWPNNNWNKVDKCIF